MIKLKDLLKEIIKEDVPDLNQPTTDTDSNAKNCSWDLSPSGIKIFFDVTPIAKMTDRKSDSFSLAGAAVAKVGQITNDVLRPVNHVGFVLSSGEVIHATPGKGILQEKLPDMEKNPNHYICVNVGGSEAVMVEKFKKLKAIAGDEAGYDSKGIIRQAPVIGKILKRLGWVKENKPYKFFCSELVANLLVRSGILKYEELSGVKEAETTGLDKYDEIDPTQLYNLIKSKAKLLPTKCDQN